MSEFLCLIVAIFIGAFAALIVWTLIVKSQVQTAIVSNNTGTLGTVSNALNLAGQIV